MANLHPTRENLASAGAWACAHCGTELAADAPNAPYCCAGCEAVAALLRDEGLTRYYDLAAGAVSPIGAPPPARAHAWLEPLLDGAVSAAGDDAATLCALELDVQGIHCAACVWLLGELFRRGGGAPSGLVVNPALGKARLTWQRGRFDVTAWVRAVERFGYQLGPSRKTPSRAGGGLTWRLGICVALSMNVMLFSLSFYFGLSRADGQLYTLFTRLSLVLSTAVVAIGGWPFFRAAGQGLRAGVLHLDLPIALGIVLVYATSLALALRGGGALTYFDTLNTFITLMLLGRFLQQRLLERNRRFLLEDDGADGIFVRRIGGAGDQVQVIRAPLVRAGDRLLVAPGELVPVDAELVDEAAAISADWISGEAAPRAVRAGALLPAGSFNAGRAAFTAVARTAFADSSLVPLLRQPGGARAGTGHLRFWDRLARRWVVTVLATAAAGLLLWLPRGAGQALNVAAALLVVTCPCGIGIALPLAYDLTQARLRRTGFFARTTDLLDRLVRVRRVIFDKTGTLTLSRLELAQPAEITLLPPVILDLAYNLACRSGHPVAACLAEALAQAGARYDDGVQVTEVSGAGLVCRRASGEWRLGRAEWAAPGAGAQGTVLSRDGAPVATFEVREALRAGAAADLSALRDDGYDLWLVSGDTPARAGRLAAVVGIPPDHVRAARTPADKAADVAALGGGETLYLGDGANDALAFDQALCAGTVAIERPVLPGRSDFFLVGAHLAPLRQALGDARRLRQVARRVLVLSVAYNAFSVAVCLLGLMTPLRAALFMPLSSLSLILFTVASLQRGPRPAPVAAAVPS